MTRFAILLLVQITLALPALAANDPPEPSTGRNTVSIPEFPKPVVPIDYEQATGTDELRSADFQYSPPVEVDNRSAAAGQKSPNKALSFGPGSLVVSGIHSVISKPAKALANGARNIAKKSFSLPSPSNQPAPLSPPFTPVYTNSSVPPVQTSSFSGSSFRNPMGTVALRPQGITPVHVNGYFRRSSGVYVAPHFRSAPNISRIDNFSTKGNFNPYTGRLGHRKLGF